MTTYDRIRKLRQDQDMSQAELAEKVGYKGRSMISHIESGRIDLSQSKVKAFARALNTSVDYLIDGETKLAEEADACYKEMPTREDILLSLFRSMTDEDKEKLIDYAHYLIDLFNRRRTTK